MDIRVTNEINKLSQLGISEEDANIMALSKFGYDDAANQLMEIKKQNESYILSELNNLYKYNIEPNEQKDQPK